MMKHFNIAPVDLSLKPKLLAAWDQKTKPRGSLGRLEELGVQLGLIQGTVTPQIQRPVMMVFAGDHGLAAEKAVSPYPQTVTAAMVANFASGGAAINVLSECFGWHLQLINSGVAIPVSDTRVLPQAIAFGTQSTLHGPAMTKAQYQLALDRGATLMRFHFAEGCRLLGCGEMGIGNSSAAALLLHYLTGAPLEAVVSRGAGCDDLQLKEKFDTLSQICQRHGMLTDPEQILQHFAGFEMVMMVGAILQAAEFKVPVLLDGLIVTSACLAALKIQPSLRDYLIFAHRSAAQGHDLCLEAMQAHPLLDLGLRLGEGSGAALALPLLKASCSLMSDMATFSSASVPDAVRTTP